ncbi:MAG TPA: hypothetical protein VGJ44_19395 [Kribbellaceae bacterium]|jgi:hypothetical protein
MAETYFPFDAGAGSAVLEDGWSKMARLWQTDGVDLVSSATSNQITAGTGLQVLQAAGNAMVKGFFYNNDASKAFTVPGNTSGNSRIDRIVLRLDRSGNTVTSQYLQGTPAGSPVAPALTQAEGGVWEIPFAQFTVVNNATVPSNIVDERYPLFDFRLVTITKFVASDIAYTSDTTLDDVTGLTIPVVANAKYRFECEIIFDSASNTPDLKAQFVIPSGATHIQYAESKPVGITGSYPHTVEWITTGVETSTALIVAGTLSVATILRVRGVITIGSTPGIVKVQAAQNTSNATATNIRAGSLLKLERVA